MGETSVHPTNTTEDVAEPVDLVWERLFHQIRRGKGAAQALQSGIPGPGTLVDYPTWVAQPMPGAAGRCFTWPIRAELEPGQYLPAGVHQIPWKMNTTDGSVSGSLSIIVGDTEIPRVSAPQLPPWVAQQIPTQLHQSISEVTSLQRQAARLMRTGENARSAAVQLGITLVQRVLSNHKIHLAHLGPSFNEQDAMQAGMARLVQDLDHFASPQRPACSWTWACMVDINRDLQRAMAHGDNESYALAAARSWLWAHPQVRTVVQARQAGLHRYSDATVKLALQRPFGSVSLSTWAAHAQTGSDEVQDDRLAVLGQQDDRLSSDPATGQALLTLLARVGIGPKEAEPWLYRVGALDFPHTPGEVRAKYGRDGANRAASVERRFFAPYALDGEDWGRADDRARIRARAKAALVAEDALIATETGDQYLARQLRGR